MKPDHLLELSVTVFHPCRLPLETFHVRATSVENAQLMIQALQQRIRIHAHN